MTINFSALAIAHQFVSNVLNDIADESKDVRDLIFATLQDALNTICDDTAMTVLLTSDDLGDAPADTVTGDMPADTVTGDMPADTVTGDMPADTVVTEKTVLEDGYRLMTSDDLAELEAGETVKIVGGKHAGKSGTVRDFRDEKVGIHLNDTKTTVWYDPADLEAGKLAIDADRD